MNVRDIPDMDKECLELCEQINRFKGIETIGSCCGHGETPYHIFFIADSLESLPDLVYWFSQCHCGLAGWTVQVTTDCAASPVKFVVDGPIDGYEDSLKIAGCIKNGFDELPQEIGKNIDVQA